MPASNVRDLASRFGTPTYVYDAAKIVERVERPEAVRRDSLCPEGVLEHRDSRPGAAARRGGRCGERGGDAPGAWRRDIKAGQTGDEHPEIVYTADIFDRESLETGGRSWGIPVNCGSPDMIDQLGERAPGSDITLRINPGFGHGHSQKTNTGGEQSKHGIWHEQLDDCLRRADQHGLSITGLHMHIGSGHRPGASGQVCGAMEKAAADGRPLDHDDQRRRRACRRRIARGRRTSISTSTSSCGTRRASGWKTKFGHKMSLEIEPGRYLVAESGYLVSEIRAIKQMGEQHVLFARRGLQ